MDEKQIQEYLEAYAEKWLNTQKDTLLLQLVGFIMDTKANLEKKIGSGEVQKIFAEDGEDGEWVNEEEEEEKEEIDEELLQECIDEVVDGNANAKPLVIHLE